MYKQGDGYFWIGGPGEEAFNVPLGLLVDKGQGVDHDYLHLHYRSSGTLLAMGADPVDSLRQMKNTATDPYSSGRNFAGHYSVRKWNVAPGELADRGAVLDRDRHRARRRRSGDGGEGHHHRAGRRRRHGRGRLRDVPRVELAQGQRAADPHDRHQQPVRHLDAVRRPARRDAHRRPRQGVRHADRRPSTATIPRRATSR